MWILLWTSASFRATVKLHVFSTPKIHPHCWIWCSAPFLLPGDNLAFKRKYTVKSISTQAVVCYVQPFLWSVTCSVLRGGGWSCPLLSHWLLRSHHFPWLTFSLLLMAVWTTLQPTCGTRADMPRTPSLMTIRRVWSDLKHQAAVFVESSSETVFQLLPSSSGMGCHSWGETLGMLGQSCCAVPLL